LTAADDGTQRHGPHGTGTISSALPVKALAPSLLNTTRWATASGGNRSSTALPQRENTLLTSTATCRSLVCEISEISDKYGYVRHKKRKPCRRLTPTRLSFFVPFQNLHLRHFCVSPDFDSWSIRLITSLAEIIFSGLTVK
jgi:hypothetical protein